MLRTHALPLLRSRRARHVAAQIVELAGGVCIVVAAWRLNTTLGVAALGLGLLIASLPIDTTDQR